MRSNRTPAVYYDDIAAAIVRLQKYCEGVSFERFETDAELQDAVLYRLLILTEAARRLRDEELALCPGPDWRKICGLGNVLRHDYDSLDLGIIWEVIHDKLPSLREAVESTMREHFPNVPRS